MWERIAIGLLSGVIGALAVYAINLVIQDKREKRAAIKDYLRRWRSVSELARRDFHNEVFVSFSGSRTARKHLREARETSGDETRKKLLKAMCRSTQIKYGEFLMGG